MSALPDPAGANSLPEPVQPSSTGRASPPTILVVDDEPSILSALRRLFRPQGYRVLTADSGAQALDLARSEPVELIISDMRMPVMDGAQFLQEVRVLQPEAVRILLTGYADITSTIAAINGGEIHRYIAKPWDDNDIVLVVQDALVRRALESRNRELTTLTTRQNEELRALNAGLEDRVRHRTAEIGQINDMLEVSYEELKSNFTLSIKIFSGLMELRHDGFAGQSRRVSERARQVCARMGLDERTTHDVHLAGLLHDIGKIGFPDAMLAKPVSTMTADELQRFRKHPLNAEAALMSLAQLRPAARIIRSQHERMDGKGFPDGLEGNEIVLGARILAPIVDFENLCCGNMAERRFSVADATASIQRGAGSRYDPDIIDAFLEVLKVPFADEIDDRRICAQDLSEGMVLSRDLSTPLGTLLLAAGYVFDARIVAQVREYARREGVKLVLHVHKETSSPNAPPPPVAR